MMGELKSMEKIRTMKLLDAVNPELADMLLTLEQDLLRILAENIQLTTELAEQAAEVVRLREETEYNQMWNNQSHKAVVHVNLCNDCSPCPRYLAKRKKDIASLAALKPDATEGGEG
jgi:hypothetical protein